jgi:small-conductance mechanosensitive channel
MAPASTNLSDVFLGSEQSKYAGIALFITILIICLAILFTSSKIPIEQRLVFVIFILIITVPSILMSLFELTCIVTGGNYNTRWWCWALAWVLAIMIIFYCVMIIISLFISMTNYDMANERITEDIANNKVDDTTDNINANNYAKNIMNTYEQDLNNQSQYSRNSSSTPSQEYQPPVPPAQQPPVPQQSQHMSSAPSSRSAPAAPAGGYTGFDASDNYAPLDASFVPVKQPMRQQPQRANGNSDPRTNETVEPYMNEENEQFAPY